MLHGLQIFSEYVPYTLLIETIPTRFCSLTCRKQKFFQSKILQEGLCVTISSCHFLSFMSDFCPLLNVYFSGVQISRWLHLSNSFWGTPIRCNLLRKRIDQKNVLLQQQISELLQIPRYSEKGVENNDGENQPTRSVLLFK